MTINLGHIFFVVIVLVAWVVLYFMSVILRFGSNLTFKSEMIALGITAIPVGIGVLYKLGWLNFVW